MGVLRKKPPKPGQEKMNLEKSVKLGGRVVDNEEEKKLHSTNNMRAVAFIFAFSIVFAFLYSEYYVDKTSLMKMFGDKDLNKMFFGPGYPSLIGDPTLDQGLVIFLRGIFFTLVFGISPYLTHLYVKLTDARGGSFYYKNWATIAFAAFAYALWDSMLGPLLADVVDMFSMG